jgi:hypothetical protein
MKTALTLRFSAPLFLCLLQIAGCSKDPIEILLDCTGTETTTSRYDGKIFVPKSDQIHRTFKFTQEVREVRSGVKDSAKADREHEKKSSNTFAKVWIAEVNNEFKLFENDDDLSFPDGRLQSQRSRVTVRETEISIEWSWSRRHKDGKMERRKSQVTRINRISGQFLDEDSDHHLDGDFMFKKVQGTCKQVARKF